MSDGKSEISSSYISNMLANHGSKRYPAEKHALITGVGKKNIGAEIVWKFASNGIFCETIQEQDFDLTRSSAMYALEPMFKRANVLVLCHGKTHLDWIENQSYGDVFTVILSSLMSHINMISNFVKHTINTEDRKSIIVIGSMAASSVLNGSSPYCAAKAGLQHFVKCVAYELAPKGYDVYIINPSNVQDSPMSEQTIDELAYYRGITIDQARQYWSANHVRDSFLTKSEISELAYDLACGKFPYLSGTPLNLTGGQR